MKSMKLGEKAFFYQSNCKEPGIVGIMEIVREAYPDHTAFQRGGKYYDAKSSEDNPTWYMVDCKLVRRLKRVIGLHELKTHKNGALADMALFKQSRLSVQPVKGSEWSYILDLEDNSPDAEA
ncbi:hypothetical protein QBZ16_000317 [Prototheca wickerhamii]|uniref:EVE domain-containing protein n=1 Tax=Prototheca wickerhamii TaxID=3111 RepID=A0AAD9IKX7_PROWI|nr:hypothetical protein QBZ16_000317 [Prototheca wickerhamii]